MVKECTTEPLERRIGVAKFVGGAQESVVAVYDNLDNFGDSRIGVAVGVGVGMNSTFAAVVVMNNMAILHLVGVHRRFVKYLYRHYHQTILDLFDNLFCDVASDAQKKAPNP